MDRRTQKTRTAIMTAFEDLLSVKRYESITVQEIIDRANVGRSTFYAHFETRDALLDQTCRALFAHVFAAHPAGEPGHDFSCRTSLDARLTHILYHLQEDRQRYGRLFSGASAGLFWSYFQAQFLQQAAGWGLEQNAAALGLPEDFYLNFYSSAYMEAVRWWFRSGLQASPEELASYFLRAASPAAAAEGEGAGGPEE